MGAHFGRALWCGVGAKFVLTMKIGYKTHPILEKLEKKSLGKMPVLEVDRYFFSNSGGQILNESFKRTVDNFKEITYISSAFAKAAFEAAPKLVDLYKDIVLNDIGDLSINGSFILGETVFFLKHIIKKELEFQETTFFAFDKSAIPFCFYETGAKDNEGTFGWASNFHIKEIEEKGLEDFIFQVMSNLIIFYMFKSYASVETKYIEPKSKMRKDLKTYKNDTNLGITYLTSKWFTNLVRSEGFLVRGHFRLQPKKVNGEWTKELIWIEGFEKSGYTSKAQILEQ